LGKVIGIYGDIGDVNLHIGSQGRRAGYMEPVAVSEDQLQPPVYVPKGNAGAPFAVIG